MKWRKFYKHRIVAGTTVEEGGEYIVMQLPDGEKWKFNGKRQIFVNHFWLERTNFWWPLRDET